MFKVSDRIRIIDKPPTDPNASPCWIRLMDASCGQVGVVDQVDMETGHLRIGIWWFHPSWVTPERFASGPRDQAILTWQSTEQNMKIRRDEILRKIFGG